MSINYVIGDATQPVGEWPKIIVHVCNDIGGWGRGFVTAISKRWPEADGVSLINPPEEHFRASLLDLWYAGASPFGLWQKVVDLEKANAS